MVNPLPPPLAGVVGDYNHHEMGEEMEWRPLLLHADPCVPANLKICQKVHRMATKNEHTVCTRCCAYAHNALVSLMVSHLLQCSPCPPILLRSPNGFWHM